MPQKMPIWILISDMKNQNKEIFGGDPAIAGSRVQ